MKKKLLAAVVSLAALSPFMAQASSLTTGESLPTIAVKEYGQIVLRDGDESYKNWNSEDMLGKVRVVQAIAGRSSAKELNQPLMKAITASQFPTEKYQTTTIINQDDAIWGTGSFVKSKTEDSKKEYPWSSIVLDEHGVVAKAWQLKEDSSAIIVLNKKGKILFVKQGALDKQQVNEVLQLVKANL